MARTVRDTSLETRNARRRLKVQGKPYWRALNQGVHLGYRKGAKGSAWVARRLNEAGRYEEARIGLADDFQDADGVAVFDYSQAQKAVQDWFHRAVRIDAGMEEAVTKNYTVEHAMADYMKSYAVEGKAVQDTQTMINAHILPDLGKVELAKLNTKRITDWHHTLATKPVRLRVSKLAPKQKINKQVGDNDSVRPRRASANRILTILKAALNHAWREGKVPNDTAWRKVKPFKNVDAPVIRYLAMDECQRLINACQPDFRILIQAALFTGCRYGELTKLKAGDFNTDSGTLVIRDSKTRHPRHVVLTAEAQQFFEQVLMGKASGDLIFTNRSGLVWGKSHQCRPLAEACKHASISPAVSFHILRHTHGSLLAMQGVPMPVIAKQLGHKDTRMTEKHYAHLSPSYVADTIRQNFPKLGLSDKNVVQPLRIKGKGFKITAI